MTRRRRPPVATPAPEDRGPRATHATRATPAPEDRGLAIHGPDFAAAVRAAEAAIREHMARPVLHIGRAPLTREAADALLRAIVAAGRAPTPAEAAALSEAWRARPVGRPRKRMSTADAGSAAAAGLRALGGSPLRLYRNPVSRSRSRCDAVALAMLRCGFRNCTTSAAVENIARKMRRAERAAEARGAARLAAALAEIGRVSCEVGAATRALGRIQDNGARLHAHVSRPESRDVARLWDAAQRLAALPERSLKSGTYRCPGWAESKNNDAADED